MLARLSTRSSWKGGNIWFVQLRLPFKLKTGSNLRSEFADSRLQVRNEIAVLKKVSSGHRNIVTLYDYFEASPSPIYHLSSSSMTSWNITHRRHTIFTFASISVLGGSSSTEYAPRVTITRREYTFTWSVILDTDDLPEVMPRSLFARSLTL